MRARGVVGATLNGSSLHSERPLADWQGVVIVGHGQPLWGSWRGFLSPRMARPSMKKLSTWASIDPPGGFFTGIKWPAEAIASLPGGSSASKLPMKTIEHPPGGFLASKWPNEEMADPLRGFSVNKEIAHRGNCGPARGFFGFQMAGVRKC